MRSLSWAWSVSISVACVRITSRNELINMADSALGPTIPKKGGVGREEKKRDRQSDNVHPKQCNKRKEKKTYPKTLRKTTRWGPRSTHAVLYLLPVSLISHTTAKNQSNGDSQWFDFQKSTKPQSNQISPSCSTGFWLGSTPTPANAREDMTIDSGVIDLNRSSSRKRVI